MPARALESYVGLLPEPAARAVQAAKTRWLRADEILELSLAMQHENSLVQIVPPRLPKSVSLTTRAAGFRGAGRTRARRFFRDATLVPPPLCPFAASCAFVSSTMSHSS